MAYFPYITLASGISINSSLFSCCCFQNDEFKVCGAERRPHLSFLRATKQLLFVNACCLLVFIVNDFFIVKTTFFTIKMLNEI